MNANAARYAGPPEPPRGSACSLRQEPHASARPSPILRLKGRPALSYERLVSDRFPSSYRDSVCALCERTVSLALDIPLSAMQAKTRSTKEVALARQIAMYLSHTVFGVAMTEVGLHFRRDRTTVSHACAVVETRRDDVTFDLMMCQLEALLCNALEAIETVWDGLSPSHANSVESELR